MRIVILASAQRMDRVDELRAREIRGRLIFHVVEVVTFPVMLAAWLLAGLLGYRLLGNAMGAGAAVATSVIVQIGFGEVLLVALLPTTYRCLRELKVALGRNVVSQYVHQLVPVCILLAVLMSCTWWAAVSGEASGWIVQISIALASVPCFVTSSPKLWISWLGILLLGILYCLVGGLFLASLTALSWLLVVVPWLAIPEGRQTDWKGRILRSNPANCPSIVANAGMALASAGDPRSALLLNCARLCGAPVELLGPQHVDPVGSMAQG